MAVFVNRFLNMKNPDQATIHDVVDHIMHIVEVAGWECVGVGSDFSGTPAVPIGLEVRRLLLGLHTNQLLISCRMSQNTQTSLPCWPSAARQMSNCAGLRGRICYEYGETLRGEERKSNLRPNPMRQYGKRELRAGPLDLRTRHSCSDPRGRRRRISNEYRTTSMSTTKEYTRLGTDWL